MFNKQSLMNKMEQAEINKLVAYANDDGTGTALRKMFEAEWTLKWLRFINATNKFPTDERMILLRNDSCRAVARYTNECDKHV